MPSRPELELRFAQRLEHRDSAPTRRSKRAAVLLALLATACGYTQGFGSAKSYGIKSVAITTVDNATFRQGLDVRLTRRLGRDLPRFTGLVPGTQERADARLEVRLSEVHGRAITEQLGGAIFEGAVQLVAEVRLVSRAGTTLHDRRYVDWAEFRTPVGEGLASAYDEAIGDLVRRILIGIDEDLR